MATSQALDVQLTREDAKEIYRKLHQARNKWFKLGEILGVELKTLSNIEDMFRGDLDICLREMVYHLLLLPTPPTWRVLCQSLRSSTVGCNDLADEISKQMGAVVVESMDTQTLDTKLTPNHLHQVYTKLKRASMNWRQMGNCLNLSPQTLSEICDQHRDSTNSCLHEMLKQRLKTGPPLTWSDICQCLKNPKVKRKDLATAIEVELKSSVSQHKYQRLSEQLYVDAIQKGSVTIKTSTVLLFGMAGTGKTSTKQLLLGLPPPVRRNSTSVAESADPIHIREIRDLSHSGMIIQEVEKKWKRVTASSLKRLVVDVINSYVKSISDRSELPEELETKMKQISMPQEQDDPSSMESSLSSKSIASADGESMEYDTHDSTLFLRHVSDVVRDIQSMVDTQSGSEVFGSKWIYLIDSGGQPHFQNLLPLFVQGISVALYVFRLSDRLEDYPLVEYYKAGRQERRPFKSHLTTEDNFKYLVQSIQSSQNKDCHLICIGTHLDKMDDNSETIEEKYARLYRLLPDSIVEKCHFDDMNNGLVFAINACSDNHTERKRDAFKLRKEIEKCPFKKIKVPVWWYILELILKKISNEENCKVFSIEQCKAVAKELHLEEGSIFGALKFFHTHHIFHYYPDILPNIVFSDTQVLLDKVTELVEYAAYLRHDKQHTLGQGTMIQVRDRGIISPEFLDEFHEHYVNGLFEPAELLQIFEHLLIATIFNSSPEKLEYFMPSLLGILSAVDIDSLRNKALQQSSSSSPLIIQFKSGWPQCGIFCCLQVYLIKERGWSLGKLSGENKRKQNAVNFFLPDEPYSVALIDSITYIEVYVLASLKTVPVIPVTPRVCHEVKTSILSGIKSACKALHYDNEEPELALFCPHNQSDSASDECDPPPSKKPKPDHHPAIILDKRDYMRCTRCEDHCYRLEEQHKMWTDPGYDSGSRPRELNNDIDYSLTDCSNAYNTMVRCSVKLNHAMSQDPKPLAHSLHGAGFISQSTLDETVQLNEIKSSKGSRLYSAVLGRVQSFPRKFADFIEILRRDRSLYGDVLAEIDREYQS